MNLSSERLEADAARVYSITVECRDDSGNVSKAVIYVTVPAEPPQPTPPSKRRSHRVEYARATDRGSSFRRVGHGIWRLASPAAATLSPFTPTSIDPSEGLGNTPPTLPPLSRAFTKGAMG